MDAVERNGARETEVALDTFEDLPATREKRRRLGALHLAFVVEEEIVKQHAQWWGPETKARWHANPASQVGADAAISARTAGERGASTGQELSGDGSEVHGGLVRSARERKVATWEKFLVFKPV